MTLRTLKLLGSTEGRITKDKNGKNVLQMFFWTISMDKNLFTVQKKSPRDALKIRETAEAAGDLVENKIAEKIMKAT